MAAALPNLVMSVDLHVIVKRCDHTTNPNCENPFHVCRCRICGVRPPSLTRPFEMIGLRDAWDMVTIAGVQLNPTVVGVRDSPFWGDSPELNNTDGPRLFGLSAGDLEAQPAGGHPERVSHGTTVTHTLAADHRVGRSIDVASVVKDNLSVLLRAPTGCVDLYSLAGPDGEEENGEEDDEEAKPAERDDAEPESDEEGVAPTLMHIEDHTIPPVHRIV